MSADILGIHGVGNWSRAAPADAAQHLATTWRTALNLESVAAAYYAHHLRTYHQGPPDDLDDLDTELNGQATVLLAALMAAHGWHDDRAQGRTLAPIRQLASWFVLRYGVPEALAERFLATFLGEVAHYFDPRRPTGRLAARTEVATAISAHRPRIVIAHSLGSVITTKPSGPTPPCASNSSSPSAHPWPYQTASTPSSNQPPPTATATDHRASPAGSTSPTRPTSSPSPATYPTTSTASTPTSKPPPAPDSPTPPPPTYEHNSYKPSSPITSPVPAP